MNRRYEVKHDTDGDYCVVDLNRCGIPIASGLTLEEAEETANRRNLEDEQERAKYV